MTYRNFPIFLWGVFRWRSGTLWEGGGVVEAEPEDEALLVAFAGFAQEPSDCFLEKVVERAGFLQENLSNGIGVVQLTVPDEGHSSSFAKDRSNLSSEVDSSGLPIHFVDDGDRLKVITFLTQQVSSFLLTFLNGYPNACDLTSSLLHQVDQRVRGLPVGKEIIHNQHLVFRVEIWLGNEDIVHLLMGE